MTEDGKTRGFRRIEAMKVIRRTITDEIRFVRKVRRDRQVAVRRWRRLRSLRSGFIERNHNIAKTLMIAGTGRSGSTWLSEVLVETFSCRMIFEPLRRDRVPVSAGLPWGSYADPGRDDPELRQVLERILSGRLRSRWSDRHNAYRFPRRRLVKEIRATNLLPWLSAQFPQMPIVYLLRHPVPTAWSAMELGWDPFLSEFLGQPRLMDGPLAPWREVIARHGADPDLFHRHVLRWCMENVVPISLLSPGSVHVVFYEDLVEDPHGELRRLAAYLRRFGRRTWAFDPNTRPMVDRPSFANFRKTPMMSPDERLRSWVGTVPQPSVERAVALLGEFGLDRVYATPVRPLVEPDDVLLGAVAGPQVELPGSSRGTESSNSM